MGCGVQVRSVDAKNGVCGAHHFRRSISGELGRDRLFDARSAHDPWRFLFIGIEVSCSSPSSNHCFPRSLLSLVLAVQCYSDATNCGPGLEACLRSKAVRGVFDACRSAEEVPCICLAQVRPPARCRIPVCHMLGCCCEATQIAALGLIGRGI